MTESAIVRIHNAYDVTIRRLESIEDITTSQALRFRVWSEQEGVVLNDIDSGRIADSHDDHAHHWQAYDGDTLIGSARVCIHADLESAPDGGMFAGLPIPLPTASINRLVISRTHRAHGLAARLDRARITFAREFGAKSVIVTPLEGRRRIAALSHMGFTIADRRGITSGLPKSNYSDVPIIVGTHDARLTDMEIVDTKNGFGWTTTIPNQITVAFLEFIAFSGVPRPIVLDIGCGFGVATLPALAASAEVIAMDLYPGHLESVRDLATARGFGNRLTTRLAVTRTISTSKTWPLSTPRTYYTSFGARRLNAARPVCLNGCGPVEKLSFKSARFMRVTSSALSPVFEDNQRRGVKWPGEVTNARDYVLPQFQSAIPNEMNFLTGPPLVDAYEKAGFQIERSWYYTRTGRNRR